MALKDLIASKATLAEEAIEAVVAKYVHYDVDHNEVVLTPAGAALSTKQKLLVYLVALQGWPFVTDETVATDASPSHIADQLGLPGGTVRPLLMDLADRHLIVGKDGRYLVRAANLPSITKELAGEVVGRVTTRRAAASPRTKSKGEERGEREEKGGRKRAAKQSKTSSQSAKFEGWIDGGFFDQSRTLGDVGNKFREEGIIIARTSIPQLLLKAVRSGRLARKEADVAGKNVWVYLRNAKT
ncbi:MAG: hypothetical protein K2Y27_30890 [Xanthobacteraceae bacterium]|nr:hypothetical protein [Xanthobacteraceae bacterium]